MTFSRRLFFMLGATAVAFPHSSPSSAEECLKSLAPTGSIDPPPEYLPGAPIRTSFLKDGAGQRIRIFGRAVSTTCKPVTRARLDFWQTNEQGLYDANGYRFRGAQQTDENGKFLLETVMPGRYNGPRHVHLLLATRIGNQPQPLMLSAGIFFPTKEEFGERPAVRRPPEFLDPSSLETLDGVLQVPCDIVLQLT